MSDTPQEVKQPKARRTRKPLGIIDNRPPVRAWLDAPSGRFDVTGKLSHLEVTSERVNVVIDLTDGKYIILDVHYTPPPPPVREQVLNAMAAARDWLNRFAIHGPESFGGEAEIDEQLRAAIIALQGDDNG